MRTKAEFLSSLKDGRDVRYMGESIRDLATHPALGVCVRHAASAFDSKPENLADSDWIVTDGTRAMSGFYAIPRSSEDLLRRARLIEGLTAQQWAQFNIIKVVGSDAMFALATLRDRLAAAPSAARAGEAIDSYIRRCQDDDIATAAALTDPKGDRSQRPAQQAQRMAYLRIVERNERGIVVRGAKVHTTSAPVVDEIVVLPTRAMASDEADYAVSFTVRTNAPGLRMICRPVREALDEFDNPVSARAFETETTTIFDNVFVPWENVFLAGDTELAGELARTFATFHRFTGLSYKPPLAELLLATTQWIAADNGLLGKPLVRARLAELVNYVALIRAARTASAIDGTLTASGVFMPDPVQTNAGKHFFASNFHRLSGIVHDIAGGLVVTAPSVQDLIDDEDGPWIERIFESANDDSVRRLIAFNIIRDLTAGELGGYNYVASIHGEGSMNAQLLSAYEEFDYTQARRMLNALFVDVLADGRLDKAGVGTRGVAISI
jgi:4-hydroxybutyryl-CoA dehydratase/vinylacetyl-CoA-Delta-isomerase